MNIKYINIPSKLVFDSNIPALAKIIYGQLKVLSYKNGVCEISNNSLSKWNNCSERTITRIIKNLKDNGYIEIEDNGSRKIRIP